MSKRDYRPEFEQLCLEARQQIQEVHTQSLHQWLEEEKPFTLIDVREAREFQTGKIHSATHLCRGEIEVEIHQLLPSFDTCAVLYCGSGNRSALAIVNLQKMGYTHLYSLAGGIKKWIQEGYPIEEATNT